MFFSWNYFLWRPILRLFYLAMQTLGYQGRTYEALQWFNTLIGTGGVIISYLALKKYGTRSLALAWAILVGVGDAYWTRSTSGESYLTGTFFTILFCLLFIRCWKNPRQSTFTLLSLTAALSTYFHIANGLLWIMAGVIYLLKGPKDIKNILIFFMVNALIIFPYAWTQELLTVAGIQRWWRWGSGLTNGISPLTNHTGQFNLNLFTNLDTSIKTLIDSIISPRGHPIVYWATALLLAWTFMIPLFEKFWSKSRLLPLVDKKIATYTFGAVFILFFILFTLWQPGNMIYWATPSLISIIILALVSLTQGNANHFLKLSGLWLLIVMTGTNNLIGHIWPNHLGREAIPMVEFCNTMNEITPKSSPILIPGTRNGGLKVFIPYFSHRQAIALDLNIMRNFNTQANPIDSVSHLMADYFKKGIPVYMTGDFLDAAADFDQWNIKPDAVKALLEPYHTILIAQYSPPISNALYLLWPRNTTPEIKVLLRDRLNACGLLGQYNRALYISEKAQVQIPSNRQD